MARKLRVQYPGAIYHVMSRGNGKAAIFRTDVDRRSFLQTLAEASAKTGWQVHAYCLMTVREKEAAQAERTVKAELKRLGWREKDLSMRRKGDPEKVGLARLLRQKTTMTIGAVAERLQMGTAGHLSHLLYWEGKNKPKAKGRK